MDYYLVPTPGADLDRDRLDRFFAEQPARPAVPVLESGVSISAR
jgi:hypothetical protein